MTTTSRNFQAHGENKHDWNQYGKMGEDLCQEKREISRLFVYRPVSYLFVDRINPMTGNGNAQ